MADNSNITPLRMTAARAQKRINELVDVDESVIASEPFWEQALSLDLIDKEVLDVLREGVVTADPTPMGNSQWKCMIGKATKGGRKVVVEVIIWMDNRLILVTLK